MRIVVDNKNVPSQLFKIIKKKKKITRLLRYFKRKYDFEKKKKNLVLKYVLFLFFSSKGRFQYTKIKTKHIVKHLNLIIERNVIKTIVSKAVSKG